MVLKRFRKQSNESLSAEVSPAKSVEVVLVTAALLSIEPIDRQWSAFTGESPMSPASSLAVRAEMLFFFLHMLDRLAFEAGGPSLRDKLVDAVAVNAIEVVIASSFRQTAKAKQESTASVSLSPALSRMKEVWLDMFEETELEYGACSKVTSTDIGSFFREETVIGKLAGRIERHANQPGIVLRHAVMAIATQSLISSGLKEAINRAAESLGK